MILIIAFVILALFAPFFSPHEPSHLYNDFLRVSPVWTETGSSSYIFGTDDVGRDILSRLIYGARISMSIGLAVVFLAMFVGTLLGLFAGYYGGWIDKIVMRITDIIMALPSILLAIVVVAILGPGLRNAVIAVAIVAIPSFTRIVRASVLSEKEKEYVQASRSLGASSLRTMFKEVLPNCMAPLIVQATLGFSDGILNAAALGFLGLGAQPPTPEWGIMLSDARPFIESSPWMVTLPGVCISVVVLGFNLFGDGLRDALDPRLKGRG
ncbi:MAG: ABC transporter permease subunit [Bacteriovoracaceae bacterium]|nr:ABC transporter permease subunit [Bacteriovoracaceae bacterium]